MENNAKRPSMTLQMQDRSPAGTAVNFVLFADDVASALGKVLVLLRDLGAEVTERKALDGGQRLEARLPAARLMTLEDSLRGLGKVVKKPGAQGPSPGVPLAVTIEIVNR